MPLFRPEAMRSQDRLHGEVSLVPPVSWQTLGIFLFMSVASAGAFLALASYAKTTTVQGEIQSNLGTVRAVPARPGVVDEILVQEGQHVDKGQVLARISVAQMEGGASLESRRLDAITRRANAIDGRGEALAADARARLQTLQAQIEGGVAELSSLAVQIEQQREMVRRAEEELGKIQGVAARGFISGNDVRQREDRVSERRQDLARLQQDQATRRSQIAIARAEMSKAQTELGIQMRSLEGDRAEADEAAADAENARTIQVVAGSSGTVTGITGHRGDPVETSRALMSIVPDGSKLQAVLQIPTSAAGFIDAGQSVRVAVDAYPYQTYGTVSGTVLSVSDAAIPMAIGDGGSQDVFLARASLARTKIDAYGRTRTLRPGMAISARITTRRRSLLGLLFDPLYAVTKR